MDEKLIAKKAINVPGSSCKAILMLPFRLLLTLILWTLTYPIFLIIGVLRALFMRIFKGRPSQILKYGTYGQTHMVDMHYPNHQIYKEPLDEKRLRKVLVELCAEDGITEDMIDLKFNDEKPNDWPPNNSWDIDYFVEGNKDPNNKGKHYWDYCDDRSKRGEPGAFMKIHVWNNDPGKPTIMYYFGSGNKWDGSSNFNFCKELNNRYIGNPPNKVFQQHNTEITPEAAKKFDQGWFICWFLKLPFAMAKNWFMILWNIVRAFKWAGGNGFGFKMTAMNLTKIESEQLYGAALKLGVKPFAIFTYATVKACREVLKQSPLCLTQQASLQTRHFPLKGQSHRDLVGDWLFGPLQMVPKEYDLKAALKGYEELNDELDNIGPKMTEAIMAKAYGLLNSGAAGFQLLPTYTCSWFHALDRCIFMNNYGTRVMPKGAPFHTWNWNAPLWFGINTINVDGCTTTLVGSCFWGLEVVEAMRDNIEATLRGFIAQGTPEAVPVRQANMGSEKSK